MNGTKFDFVKEILGVDGATALNKAANRSERLENVILPRTILAWLGVVSREDYEGGLPGVRNSYLRFSKNEDGFTGVIGMGQELYKFDGASLYHLAASVALVLGADADKIDPAVKDLDIVRLGKSIDILAKARVAVVGLQKAEAQVKKKVKLPGTTKKAEAPMKGKADEPSFEQPTGPQAPTKQTAQPSMPRAGTSSRAVNVTKSESERRCSMCGRGYFANGKFTGCLCLSDLAKSVKATPNGNGYSLTFKAGTDAESVLTILDALKGD